jgi:hypothetical protein
VYACLLALLSSRHKTEGLATVRAHAAAPGFDWAALHEIARREALLPLLCETVFHRGLLPAEMEDDWRASYAGSLLRNVHLLSELEAVLAALQGEGITPILLKGAALLHSVYVEPALRPMADLDLLLRQEQMAAALRVLAAAGYVPVRPETRAGLAIEYENELLLQKPDSSSIPLELHWSLFDSPHHQRLIPMGWWWQSAVPVQPELFSAHILGPEAQVLHLCAHIVLHHQGRGLRWLHDIAEVIYFYQDRLDWDLLLSRAVEYDLLLPLQQILPRVVEGWGTPLPAGIRERLQGLKPSPAEMRVFRRLTASERPVARRFWDDLSAMPGWKRRLRYGLGSLFPTPDYMRRRYSLRHPMLLPLAYAWRWLIGAGSGLVAAAAFLRRRVGKRSLLFRI